MQIWKKGFNVVAAVVLFWAIFQSFAPAKIERTRVIKKDFDAKKEIVASHEHGPLLVKKSTDGRTHLEAEITVIGTDEASIQAMLDRLELKAGETGNSLEIASYLGIANWQKVNNRATVKFCDGEKIKGISDFKVTLTLYLAAPEKLRLSNKYDQIAISDGYAGDLSVVLYSGELLAGDLGGQFDLDLKYGKAKTGSVGKAKWVVYDSEVATGPVETAQVSSKYSEFRLGSVRGDLSLITYDENWQLGDVGGKLTLDDKYSEFKFGKIGAADMVVFDAEIKADQIGSLNIRDSKYTGYELQKAGDLSFTSVFDDSYEIGELDRLEIGDSKYTSYRVGRLSKSLTFGQSYDDEIKVEAVDAGFDQIKLDGKYTELDLDIADDANYELSAELQYGDIDFPSQGMDIRKHVEKNDHVSILAIKGSEQSGGNANTLKISGFDNTIKLR